MRFKTAFIAFHGLILGILTALLWMKFWHFEFFGQFISWRVLPFVLPLVISILLFRWDKESTPTAKRLNSILFFVFAVAGYAIPFVVFIALVSVHGM